MDFSTFSAIWAVVQQENASSGTTLTTAPSRNTYNKFKHLSPEEA